jgi:hypothetical protein
MDQDHEPADAGPAPAVPDLICYRVTDHAPALVPARAQRDWMDKTHERFAYRCTPMAIANASGWELLTPFAFSATWFGGNDIESVEVRTAASASAVEALLSSHFGHGILTFHAGWLFRTSPGWALWARGAPNWPKDGICALDGLVETDWLPFTFTMNWRFTRPGVTVTFEKDEPFCFITLAPHGQLDAVSPKLAALADDPALKAEHDAWSASRADFNKGLREGAPGPVSQRWQRTYIRGEGGAAPDFHVTRRRLRDPL